MDKIKELSVSITQYNSTAPQTAASKMIIQLNHHLSKTVSTKTELKNLHEDRIYCLLLLALVSTNS